MNTIVRLSSEHTIALPEELIKKIHLKQMMRFLFRLKGIN